MLKEAQQDSVDDDFLLSFELQHKKFHQVFTCDDEQWKQLLIYLDNNNWKQVGENLGFSSTELEQLQTASTSPSKELLCKFKDKSNANVEALHKAFGNDNTAKNILREILIKQRPINAVDRNNISTLSKNSHSTVNWLKKLQWTWVGLTVCTLLVLLSPGIVIASIFAYIVMESLLLLQMSIIILFFFGWIVRNTWTGWRSPLSRVTEITITKDLEKALEQGNEEQAMELCQNARKGLQNTVTKTQRNAEQREQSSIGKQNQVVELEELPKETQRQQFQTILKNLAEKSHSKGWLKLHEELISWDRELNTEVV